MKVAFKRAFLKDLEKLPRDAYQEIARLVLYEFPKATRVRDIKSVKKIAGEKNYFRIRSGYYRIGFEVRKGELILMRVLHRKDIYRYFP